MVNLKRIKLNAFTLAEIVIVVGIIGTIAALAIPNLMENVQEQQFKSAAKEAYSKAYQAFSQIKSDEGGGNLFSLYGGGRTFKPVFIKYFKVIKDCGLATCVAPSSTLYQTLSKTVPNLEYLDDGQFITADGMFWAIENPSAALPENVRIWIIVDVNGYLKKPNIFGKDVFVFEYINDQLLPMGTENSIFPAQTYCNKNISSAAQGFGCMYYVMQGIDY